MEERGEVRGTKGGKGGAEEASTVLGNEIVEQGASQRARLFEAPSVGAGFGLHQA